MSVVQVKKLRKTYDNGKIVSVNNSSFSLKEGTITALLGANGAGKSTTIKMLTGLIKPTSGSLAINKQTYAEHPDAIRASFGYVPEESAMYEDIGIFDYLNFFASIYKVPKPVAEKRISSLLKRLDLSVGNRTIGKLSKGMKRKVLIARSLIHDPDLLIYDEPASGLDPRTAQFILTFMKELRSQKKSILFSSHHLAHVEQVADDVIIMHKSKIIENTPLSALMESSTQYHVTFSDGSTETLSSVTDLKKAFSADANNALVSVEKEHRSLEDVFLDLTQ